MFLSCWRLMRPYTVADSTFESIALLSDQHDLALHMHVHETADEIDNSVREHGVRPIKRLNQTRIDQQAPDRSPCDTIDRRRNHAFG